MLLLDDKADLKCLHRGSVKISPSQTWVRIDGRPVLVDNDPESKSISLCPNSGAFIRPCETTLRVLAGYSDFIRIDGHRICLDTVHGLTDGTPAGVVEYKVFDPGQHFVSGE